MIFWTLNQMLINSNRKKANLGIDDAVCHRIGNHCGSTAIRDILEFHGMPLTEAMCFGLGGGLGVTYMETPFDGLPYIVHVRSMGFEPRVFENLDIPFHWQEFDCEEDAASVLRNQLQEGKPALLLTNIRHLPYYGTDTDFPGHAIVAWKYDENSETVYVTDTERADLIGVPEANITAARFSKKPPFFHLGSMFSPCSLAPNRRMAVAIEMAINENTQRMLNDPQDGLASLERWEQEVELWCEHENWQWTLRFAYQIIEKRGTGGGGFRKMYSEFLLEASEILPQIQRMNLVELMKYSANLWTNFALTLKQESEKDTPNSQLLRSHIQGIICYERKYLMSAQKAFL